MPSTLNRSNAPGRRPPQAAKTTRGSRVFREENTGEWLTLALFLISSYDSATFMSRIDQLTGRSANFGNSRSHSNIATRHRQNVNLQTVRLGGVKVRVSTRTLKTLKKLAAQAKGELLSKKQKKVARVTARKAKAAKV